MLQLGTGCMESHEGVPTPHRRPRDCWVRITLDMLETKGVREATRLLNQPDLGKQLVFVHVQAQWIWNVALEVASSLLGSEAGSRGMGMQIDTPPTDEMIF